MEGTLENVPSMAISVASFKWKNFEFAGEIAMNIAEQAINDSWPASLLLNLNIPPCEKNKVRKYKNQFSKREDPRGDDYYWLAGEVVLDLKSKGYGPKNWPSDVSQIQENKISLTPVEPDLFWRGNLDDLPKINNSFVNPS
jgi:5'-nucleotidase